MASEPAPSYVAVDPVRTVKRPKKTPTRTNHGLTMRRNGSFEVRTYGRNHCGVKEYLNINYNVEIRCGVQLDVRGFLFDQLSVDAYFKGIKRTELSCEQLVMSCARDLISVIMKEHPECQVECMKVTLTPEPYYASMEYTLERDE